MVMVDMAMANMVTANMAIADMVTAALLMAMEKITTIAIIRKSRHN